MAGRVQAPQRAKGETTVTGRLGGNARVAFHAVYTYTNAECALHRPDRTPPCADVVVRVPRSAMHTCLLYNSSLSFGQGGSDLPTSHSAAISARRSRLFMPPAITCGRSLSARNHGL